MTQVLTCDGRPTRSQVGHLLARVQNQRNLKKTKKPSKPFGLEQNLAQGIYVRIYGRLKIVQKRVLWEIEI